MFTQFLQLGSDMFRGICLNLAKSEGYDDRYQDLNVGS